MVKWKMYAFKKSGKYYSEIDIELPDKYSWELIEDIEKGAHDFPYSTMNRVFVPQENSNHAVPFMITCKD